MGAEVTFNGDAKLGSQERGSFPRVELSTRELSTLLSLEMSASGTLQEVKPLLCKIMENNIQSAMNASSPSWVS